MHGDAALITDPMTGIDDRQHILFGQNRPPTAMFFRSTAERTRNHSYSSLQRNSGEIMHFHDKQNEICKILKIEDSAANARPFLLSGTTTAGLNPEIRRPP